MHTVDPEATVARAVSKYGRFLDIAKENPRRMVVPTLDVDLAWHTHQLSPKTYYDVTTTHLNKFLDHDDKVAESKLSESFEWMCETYYNKYDEIYSECVCWFCEGKPSLEKSVRVTAHSSSHPGITDEYAERFPW